MTCSLDVSCPPANVLVEKAMRSEGVSLPATCAVPPTPTPGQFSSRHLAPPHLLSVVCDTRLWYQIVFWRSISHLDLNRETSSLTAVPMLRPPLPHIYVWGVMKGAGEGSDLEVCEDSRVRFQCLTPLLVHGVQLHVAFHELRTLHPFPHTLQYAMP